MRIEVSLSGKRNLPGMSPSTTASFCRSSTASMSSLQADADAAGADDGAGCRALIWSSSARSALSSLRSPSKSWADFACAAKGRPHRPVASRESKRWLGFMVTPVRGWWWKSSEHTTLDHATLGHATDEGADAVVGRVVEKLIGGCVVGNAALVEEQDAVGHLTGKAHFMGHHDHGHAAMRQFAHHVEHLLHHFGVECRGGLVKQHHLGLHPHRPGDRHPLLLAARELPRVFVRMLVHAHAAQQGD